MTNNWTAWAILTDGQKIAWPKLRQGQAKWRFDFLKRGMLYRGVAIKKCGYQIGLDEPETPYGDELCRNGLPIADCNCC
jgi:hypothetical protein